MYLLQMDCSHTSRSRTCSESSSRPTPHQHNILQAKCARRLAWKHSPNKRLSTPRRCKQWPWSYMDTKALVQFVALHNDQQANDSTEWPGMQPTDSYWTDAATWVGETTGTHIRTGTMAQHDCPVMNVIILTEYPS